VNIPVVYEDEWLLVADKPSGLLVIPTPKNESRTLTSILNDDAKDKGKAFHLHPCHRLDRETSGLMIYAKGKSTQQKMMQLFKERKVKKQYIAFVQKAVKNNEGEIKTPIEGMQAVTRYKVLERRRDFSILEVFPATGRTNQIRIHFKHIGHPLVGERKFAFRKDFSLKAKRLCLHSKSLEFEHPATKQHMQLSAPLPNDLEHFLQLHPD
jgi:23S rRNA pseudouridine1911/1915/1917 synthase